MSRSTVTAAEAVRPLFVGVDVGGTNIKIGLVDDAGSTLAYTSIPTESEKGIPDAMQRVKGVIDQLTQQQGVAAEEIVGVGLATPGTMDIPGGMILSPPNLPGWKDFPIRDELASTLSKPVTYANDAGAAAFGEYWVGTAHQYNSMVMVTLGTGVGGGIIIGDRSIDGEHSHGAEIGHIIIDYRPEARICGCGGAGHLEAYASATGVVKRVEEGLAAGAETSLAARIDAGESFTPLMLSEEAEKGDSFSIALIRETAMYLGTGVASLMHTIDPAAVVIGGAMTFGAGDTELGRQFLAWVVEEVNQRSFPTLADNTVVQYASLGGDAGYLGAAGLARTEWYQQHTAP